MYFVMFSSTVAFEEFFLRSHKAWRPLMKLFLTPVGLQVVKCVHWKVSVGLRCAKVSRIHAFLNIIRPRIHVFRKVVSVSVD